MGIIGAKKKHFLARLIKKLTFRKSGQGSYQGSLDMRQPIVKSTFHASPTSFAKTIAQLPVVSTMASEPPLYKKLELAISMKIAQHVGREAGMKVYEGVRVEEAVDQASYARILRIRYGKMHYQYSMPMEYENNYQVSHEGRMVEEVLEEVVPRILIAWAAGIPTTDKIEIEL